MIYKMQQRRKNQPTNAEDLPSSALVKAINSLVYLFTSSAHFPVKETASTVAHSTGYSLALFFGLEECLPWTGVLINHSRCI